MSDIQIYTKTICPYCVRAKNLLKSRGIDFEEISIEGDQEAYLALQERTNYRMVPQIFVKDEFIGGFQELSALNSSGKLDEMLKG